MDRPTIVAAFVAFDALVRAEAVLLTRGFAAIDCLADIVAFPVAGLTVGLVTPCLPASGFDPLVGVAAELRILDAEAAVGFERSVVIFRLVFSTEGGGGALALDRASDAAVGAYSPDEGVLGRISDRGLVERGASVGVLTREGMADTRFLAADPNEVVDCPVSCDFKGAMDLSGIVVEDLTAGLAAGDLCDEAWRVVVGLG